jgi:hypothetical protein
MPRGKMPRRGAGNRGGSVAIQAPKSRAQPNRVAVPVVSELPTNLCVNPSHLPLPEPLIAAFPEFRNQQAYFSALERLCPEYASRAQLPVNAWLGAPDISGVLPSEDANVFYRDLIVGDTVVPIFVKRIHIADPLSVMDGTYILPREGALPAPSEPWRAALAKINNPLNEAYVDAVFAFCASALVNARVSPHWCRAYGTFSARVEKYLYNITDEYDSLKNKSWWRRNIHAGIFHVVDAAGAGVTAQPPIKLLEAQDLQADDFIEVDELESDDAQAQAQVPTSADEDEPVLETSAAPVHLSTPKVKLHRVRDPPSSETSSITDSYTSSSEYIEDEIFAEFDDFPVQVTLLERADGTMDELLDAEDDEISDTKDMRWTAWLFQVIAALSAAQYYYGFVHNDLHTNNVMWSGTGMTHIYYRIHKGKSQEWYMKVPTFGRIMKIIDFGRASFHLPDHAGFFISDAFFPGNEAASQYNCEPFYDPSEGKKVEPNPSFDLCRLAISLIESLYPDRPPSASPYRVLSREGSKIYTATISDVYNMLWEWLIDDSGKNVLRNPDGTERYPEFDLYCALAADVHHAVPAKQIERALFMAYRCENKDVPDDATVYDLYI